MVAKLVFSRSENADFKTVRGRYLTSLALNVAIHIILRQHESKIHVYRQ